jgi:hypothetical protein
MSIIVIAGMSATGKKTLIRKLVAGDSELCDRFGVRGSVYPIGYSFEPINLKLAQQADSVVFQWQVVHHGCVSTLREWMPDRPVKTFWLIRDELAHYNAHRAGQHSWQPSGQSELRLTSMLMLYKHFVDYGPVELVTMEET